MQIEHDGTEYDVDVYGGRLAATIGGGDARIEVWRADATRKGDSREEAREGFVGVGIIGDDTDPPKTKIADKARAIIDES